MRILHIGLLSYFTEGMLYQDNILSDINCKDGHEVIFITNTERYVNGKLVDVGEEDIVLENGLRLIRLKYDWIISSFITKKIQKCKRLKGLLEEIEPDSILYHGCCGYELIDVAEYVKRNPDVLFYVDSHEDFNNTARNVFSKFAYKYIHGLFIRKALSQIQKVLYLGEETKHYLVSMYKLRGSILEEFPLGGIIVDDCTRKKDRQTIINMYDYPKNVLIFGHSGKMVSAKKTKELIQAFHSVKADNVRLIIYGAIPKENEYLKDLIADDDRINFVGWIDGDKQHELLHAIDLYCQPGSQSATAEIAICDGCALLLGRHEAYFALYHDNVFYAESEKEIAEIIDHIVHDPRLLSDMQRKGFELAKTKLDYRVLANRYLR